MTMLHLAWLIPLLPLAAFVLITLTPIRRSAAASGWLATGALAVAAVLALGVAAAVAQGVSVAPGGSGHGAAHAYAPLPNIVQTFRWAPAGGDAAVLLGYLIDPAAAVMLVMVTVVSACIHLYSLGYMAHDPRQARFFSFIALFTAAMLAMVVASNLLLFFIAWEIMGLCSYLLIGFWYDTTYADPRRITPRRAAIKAFVVTRIGDALLMVGLAYLWYEAGSLDLGAAPGQVFAPAFLERIAGATTPLGITTATAISLLLFCGTVGKSAQVPLHVWLPDAMEGPTPVSALIHAATMVAAGVFLVARTYPIFLAGNALPAVAFIGTLTALFGALVAVAQFDIKRILAYSTISQLGFMVAALGIGGWTAALFHLLTHAFFKALLFLGAGSVIHGVEAARGHDAGDPQDIRRMGGLRRAMPLTFWTYLTGALALAGVVPFAGFWSKDEILADALGHGRYLILAILLLASFLTAFYMARQVAVVFFGEFRGVQRADADTPRHEPAGVDPHNAERRTLNAELPHESPWTMTAPLIILAIVAVCGGLINAPGIGWLAGFLGQEPPHADLSVAALATLLALAGVGLGWRTYRAAFRTPGEADPLAARFGGLFAALQGGLGFDRLYAATTGRAVAWLAAAWNWLDRQVFDRLVIDTDRFTLFLGRVNFILDDTLLNDGADRLAEAANDSGDVVRRSETGRIQDYAMLMFGVVIVIAVLYLYVFRG